MPQTQPVSVVVNTLDRADALSALLDACEQLTYPRFEVIVVHGPCSDHTEEVLARWKGRVKVRSCPKPNLAMSRNIGIAAAAGDLVAFIDDDGIPEPTWLDELVAAYGDEEIGAVGGVVYNHTGHQFQVRFMLSDRLGNTTEYDRMPPGDFCFPGSSQYPSMLGCNSSFRTAALVEVGGFDEEYDYFLDETDVCVRLIDAGWVIRGLDGAPVHHKYLPSGIRTTAKVVTDNHSVVKNKVYFSMVNGLGDLQWTDVMADDVSFAAHRREEMHRQHAMGRIDAGSLQRGIETVETGWRAGLLAGLAGQRTLLDPDAIEHGELLTFPTIVADPRRRLVFLSRTLPPDNPGGVGRYMLDLARELARRGHEVRIITSGSGHDRVDLEDGVWVHRICKHAHTPPPRHLPVVPEMLWHNAGPVAEEVQRINRERPVDAVLSSIWDVEWVGVLASSSIPVISAYTTPFSVVRATQPDAVDVAPAIGDSIEALERWAHTSAHAFQANGAHIVESVERHSGVALDPSGLFLVPLGSPDTSLPHAGSPSERSFTSVFVGRFEPRKGIDLLLESIPIALRSDDRLRFVLAGQDDLPDGAGSTFRRRFEAEHPELVESGAVEFAGVVGRDELARMLAAADAAVLPSRFESFGLVFVEAMAAGLPVVALDGSGAEEVVDAGTTGLLCSPDAAALAEAVLSLAQDPARTEQLGRAGRARYEQLFSVEAMADRFLSMFDAVSARRPGTPEWPADQEQLVELPDGARGLQLSPGEGWGIDLLPGRNTLVVSCPVGAEGSCTVDVRSGEAPPERIEVAAGTFHHVVLSHDARRAEVVVDRSGDPPAVIAALINADARGPSGPA